jgi:hypothetical protein
VTFVTEVLNQLFSFFLSQKEVLKQIRWSGPRPLAARQQGVLPPLLGRVSVRPQAGSATPQRPIRVRKTASALHAQVRLDPLVLRSRFLGPVRPLRARNRVGPHEASRSQDRQCKGRPLRGGGVRFRIARYSLG